MIFFYINGLQNPEFTYNSRSISRLSINFFTIDDIRVGVNLKTKKTDKTKEEYARASYDRIPLILKRRSLIFCTENIREFQVFFGSMVVLNRDTFRSIFFFFSPTWLQRFLYSCLAIEHATRPNRWKHIQVALSSLFSFRLFSMIFLSRSIKRAWRIENEFKTEKIFINHESVITKE